ncbi:hypothetical protein E5288_WYG002626 [Bos mutus]|uniref:Uncharacterized protein n=1 Tax=Bos mutus TaxID=72004 RepID=A0A6B0R528_9CETA|nr:hypothetical protein [Bos mutus]
MAPCPRVPVSSRWLYSGRGCRLLKFDWEICLNTRRSAPQWDILNGKKVQRGRHGASLINISFLRDKISIIETHSNILVEIRFEDSGKKRSLPSSRAAPYVFVVHLLCSVALPPDNNEFDQKVVSGRIWPSQRLPGSESPSGEWEMQLISNDLGIRQDILPEKTSNRVQMVVRGVFGVLSFTVLPYSKAFVTLVLEIMNIHCLIPVTQAPAPSGYLEVSDPAVFL